MALSHLLIYSIIKSEAAYVIRRLTFRCLECKQPSPVGRSPLYDVVSSFLYHRHADGKDKLLEWPDRSCCCFMLARASTKTFVSRVRKQRKKSSLAGSLVSRGITVYRFSLHSSICRCRIQYMTSYPILGVPTKLRKAT